MLVLGLTPGQLSRIEKRAAFVQALGMQIFREVAEQDAPAGFAETPETPGLAAPATLLAAIIPFRDPGLAEDIDRPRLVAEAEEWTTRCRETTVLTGY